MTYTETVQRRIPTDPCVKCGVTDVRIHDCGYSSFNTGTVQCNACGYTVKVLGASSNRDYLKHWNGTAERLRIEREGHLARVAEIDALWAFTAPVRET